MVYRSKNNGRLERVINKGARINKENPLLSDLEVCDVDLSPKSELYCKRSYKLPCLKNTTITSADLAIISQISTHINT